MAVDLTVLPPTVEEGARQLARAEDETLVGWKAITAPDPLIPNMSMIVRYMVITDKGYYEYTLDGLCVRAGVLHGF